MTHTDKDRILEKVRRLLALAGNNPNEEEATAAMAKAQEMLADHNLQMAEIKADDGKSASATHRVKDTHTRSALFDYQRKLWEALASTNFCMYDAVPVYKTNTLGVRLKANYHHYLIGREDNVTTTKLMGDYLEDMITRLCPHKVGKPMFYWKEGCAERLVERLQQKRYDMEAAQERERRERQKRAAEYASTNTSTGIVLAEVYANEEDENFKFVHGQEAYDRRMSYRHDRANCVCKFCVDSRKWDETYRKAQLEVAPQKTETDAQRRRREEREAASSDRYWEAQERKRRRAEAKKDMGAFNEGRRKADSIGIDAQIGSGNKKGELD